MPDIAYVSENNNNPSSLRHLVRFCDVIDYDQSNSPPDESPLARMSFIDRLLPVWIIMTMALGLIVGHNFPSIGNTSFIAQVDGVSLPIAIGLWMMMIPVLTKVRYELLHDLLRQRDILHQFGISSFLNWIVGPALMTGLAWLCLPDLERLRNGVILVGLARCIAMVLVWNDLALGNVELCAMLVAMNSILQILLYAPLAWLYLNVVSHASIHVGIWNVARSVMIFLGVPLVGGVAIRYSIYRTRGIEFLEDYFLPYFGRISLISLLYTILFMFASQAEHIIHNVILVARVSAPMLLYFAIMFFSSFWISWKRKYPYKDAVTQAFTASGNNFELAIAISVATFGIDSPEALAATIGPLIEVPVLLGLVYFSLWLRNKYY